MRLLTLLLLTTAVAALQAQPIAPVLPKTNTIHGETITDEYNGMRDKSNPAVMRYLKQENKYTQQYHRKTVGLTKAITAQLKKFIVEQDSSYPSFENGYWYFHRFFQGKDFPIYYRRKADGSAEQLVLDENEMLKKLKAYSIPDMEVSPDNKWLAYAVDFTGNFEKTLFFKDLTEANSSIGDKIPRITSFVWSKDSKSIYYTIQDSVTNRSSQVFRHTIGKPLSEDELVYEEKDKMFETYISQSKSKEYIFITNESLSENEVWALALGNDQARPRCIYPRHANHKYEIDHANGNFYILSNWNGAENNQLFLAGEDKTDIEHWRVVIPHRKEVFLQEFDIFKGYVVANESTNGESNLVVYDLQKGNSFPVKLPWINNTEVGVLSLYATPHSDVDTFKFYYSSLRIPGSICSYDISEQKVKVLKEQKYPDYNPNDYVCERVWATASDGVKVPISLIYHKNTSRDTVHPCLLESYGSYGASMEPYFNWSVMPLLDNGWVYGIAHIRGGSDLGRQWYLNGKLLQKKNTFNDFIACTEHLIAQKYTSPALMAATGASAGGLLMGAIVNQRPDLYRSVILGVPFVDVINTMLDPNLPLTVLEYNEWGNPNDKTYYDYMRSYSPYDNVRAQAYPNMLFTTGIADEQVGYWEPTKMVAKLRKTKTDNNILLLHINMTAGHWGTPGRYSGLTEIASNWAFLWDTVLGKKSLVISR